MGWNEWICCKCQRPQTEVEIQERHSLGVYAGKYCDECWEDSGFRKEGVGGFDPLDAGESYDEI